MTHSLINSVIGLADVVGGWLLATSVQVAIIGAAVAAFDLALSHRVWPQLRASLWWMVTIAAVAPPVFDSPISVWRLADFMPVKSEPACPHAGSTRSASRETGPGTARLGHTREAPRFYIVRGGASAGVLRMVVIVWAVGLVAAVAGLAMRRRQIRLDLLGEAAAPAESWFHDVVARAARQLRLQRVPAVRVQAGAAGPCVIGICRPVVVIPAQLMSDGPTARIEHVLLHEFAHIRRYDALCSHVCLLVQLVFWFHPLIYLARRQLDVLREICCDQTVIRALRGSASAYRRTLLELARSLVGTPSAAPLGFIHRHCQIMARLNHLNRPLPRFPRAVRATAGGLFVVMLACCAPRAAKTRPCGDAPASWADLPGCLQLRYVVLRAMADAGPSNP